MPQGSAAPPRSPQLTCERLPGSLRAKRSLTHQLVVAMVCLSLLPTALCVTVAHLTARATVKRQVLGSLHAVADAKGRAVTSLLEERIAEARVTSSHERIRAAVATILSSPKRAHAEAAREDLRAHLQAALDTYRNYGAAVVVVPRAGTVLASVGPLSTADVTHIVHEAQRMRTAPNGWVGLSSVYRDSHRGEPALDVFAVIAHPDIRSSQILPTALLALHLPLAYRVFPVLDDRSGMGDTGEAVLVDQNGLVIKPLLYDREALFRRRIPMPPAFYETRYGKGAIEALDYRGVPVLEAYHHLDLPNWSLLVKIDRHEAYAPLARLLRKSVALATALTVISCAMACYLSRRIAAPIVALAGVAQRLAEGDVHARAAIRASGELAILAQELNHMAEQVATEQERLQTLIEQRTAELRASQGQLQLALEAGGIGTWQLWPQTGRLALDDRARAMLGYSPGELPSELQTVYALTYPQDLSDVRRALQDHLDGRSASFQCSWRMKHKSGEWRWVYVVGEVIERGANGSPLRMVGVQMDVTDRRHLEQRLERAARLETVGLLAGGIAHDFNNILTGISGYAAIAGETVPPGSSTAAYLTEIRDLADRASRLTHQLTAFSRQQTLEPTVVNINQLVEETTKMLKRIIGEDIDLQFYPDPDLGYTCVDVTQIEQVVMNLAVNARDAMPAGGRLTIETQNVELTPEYARTHDEVTPGPYVMLSVSDTGVGMSDDVQARIFEPFFTTKELGRGTGLGLAVVHGIVKQHGGHISCYSEPGEGTIFKVYLPRVDGAQADAAQTTLDDTAAAGSETILLVEDEEHVRRVARLSLETQGYKVLECADTAEAEKLFDEHAEEVALLLTDVVMRGGSGRDLYLRFRTRNPSLRVLYMSGYTGNSIVHRGVLHPNTPFLQKPFTPDELTKKVRATLDAPPEAPKSL